MQKYLIPILAIAAVFNITKVNAQLSQGGIPPSFTLEEKVQLAKVPYEIMPAVDVEALRAEDVYNDQFKDQPWRFGKDLFVSLNPENSGAWSELADGSRLWRLGITSTGALTINMTFDNYRLPEKARLFIYNADRSEILGAFTSLNNQEDRYFAVSPIPGESIVIEYFEPADVDFPGELNLWRVTHGYRSISEYEKAFGNSGPCNVNAICPEGDPIRDQIRSVARIIIGGNLCSGALINNTNNDGTPLFLSADHCYGNPGTVVFWFNWQSTTCANPPSSPPYNSLSGATQRARYSTSDFWLMELNQVPPAEYNVYYSGWNRTAASSITGTVYCIHHPSGDIKKISWATGGVTTSSYIGNTGSGTDHWRVGMWSDETTTEGGSSGSPLLDPQYRIIGQLHGGYAACYVYEPDWYGKLSTSWTGGGTDATRLSTWLDPAATGAITCPGYDPNQPVYTIDGALDEIIAPELYYDDTLTIAPKIVICNNGTDNLTSADISYRIDSELPVSYAWTGTLATDETDTIEFPELFLDYGFHGFKAYIDLTGDENIDNDTLEISFEVDTFKIPYGLTAEVVNDTNVLLTWNPQPDKSIVHRNATREKSEKVTLVDYSVYRNDTAIGQTSDSSFTDVGLTIGTYTYYIIANYTDPEGSSLPSDEVTVRIMDPFAPPRGLNASVSNYNVLLTWNEEVFEDGFETGSFLPWSDTIKGTGIPYLTGYPFWYVYKNSSTSYEGTYSATTNWGYDIDTWLITPYIIVTENTHLSFFWNSSYYYHVDPNDNGDLFVKVSTNDGNTWETLWTFGNIGAWDDWTWYETILDLSEYADQVILVAFNIVASDNADIHIDNIFIDNSSSKKHNQTFSTGRRIPAEPMSRSINLQSIPARSVAPQNKTTLSSFSVFRNGSEIAQTTGNNYLDESLELGAYVYYVVANYTDPDSTSEPSNVVLVNVLPTAIDPGAVKTSVIVYPNPSEGIFHISVDREYAVSVLNANGVKMDDITINTHTHSLDLSEYDKGIYMLFFRSDEKTFIIKVLVQ